MSKHVCPTCLEDFKTKSKLERHLARKNPCKKPIKHCEECGRGFAHMTSYYDHKKHSCKGKKETVESVKAENANLRMAMNASRAIQQQLVEASSVADSNQSGQSFHIGDNVVNNIQINVNVHPHTEENTSFIKEMSYEDLRKLIGCKSDASTHIKLFQLVRCNPDHPENHNILLANKDSKNVHCYSKQGCWREADFDEQLHGRIAEDTMLLVEKVPRDQRDPDFYGSHLHDIMRNCGKSDHCIMKKILEGIRGPLHETTVSLANRYKPEQAPELCDMPESCDTASTVPAQELDKRILLAEIERDNIRLQLQLATLTRSGTTLEASRE